jgi:hypothetical protein
MAAGFKETESSFEKIIARDFVLQNAVRHGKTENSDRITSLVVQRPSFASAIDFIRPVYLNIIYNADPNSLIHVVAHVLKTHHTTCSHFLQPINFGGLPHRLEFMTIKLDSNPPSGTSAV